MYDIKNAFENNNVLVIGRNLSRSTSALMLLGLTCITNSTTSCIWDSGRTIGNGAPNITAGPCVNMDLSTGQWYSANCYKSQGFGCQYTPGVSGFEYGFNSTIDTFVQSCADSTADYFRGKCYFQVEAENVDTARQKCQVGCGDLPAIHSDGVNNFIYSFSLSTSSYNKYSLIGLKTFCNGTNCVNSWLNGEVYDYSHFGYFDSNLGSCVSMTIRNDIVEQSYWINSPCNTTDPYFYVCSKDLNKICTAPQCSSPSTFTGSGDIYSPLYPETSPQDTTCEYLITESPGNVASITFPDVSLDSDSSIYIYANLLADQPFAYLRNTNFNDTVFYSPTNTLKVVFYARRCFPSNNYFHGVFSGVPQGGAIKKPTIGV